MPRNALIVAHFGTSTIRARLLQETIARVLAQRGSKAVYLLENRTPLGPSVLPSQFESVVTHVRLAGNPVLWQKEAMFNLGADLALRDGAENLVFIDDDLIPASADWLLQIETTLRTHDWVHCSSQIAYLSQQATLEVMRNGHKEAVDRRLVDGCNGSARVLPSKAYLRLNGIEKLGFCGGGWAVTAPAWERYRAWDCSNFIGGGDYFHFNRLFRERELDCHLIYGNLRSLLFNPLLEEYARIDPAWKVGYAEVALCHLWHGSWGSRKYARRYMILVLPQYRALSRREFPRFKQDQLVDVQTLLRSDGNSLLDLNPHHISFEHVLTNMADYLISRDELDFESVNTYLELTGAAFRCVEQSATSKWARWILCDLPGFAYPALRGIERRLPESVRQAIWAVWYSVSEKGNVRSIPINGA